jgi:hypothetical protein
MAGKSSAEIVQREAGSVGTCDTVQGEERFGTGREQEKLEETRGVRLTRLDDVSSPS